MRTEIRWSVGVALSLCVLGPFSLGAQQPSGSPQPAQTTSQQDRQRLMDQLKITMFPSGAASSNPATYDEATASPYPNLPDPLTMKNGRKVTSAAMWKQRRGDRRSELADVPDVR